MLSGFTSRWMIPSACAAPSASAVSCMMRRDSSAGSEPRRLSLAATDSPSTYAITKYTSPSGPSPTEWMGTDRKSTRLNSSHGYISYAVFCLKKKKKKIKQHISRNIHEKNDE